MTFEEAIKQAVKAYFEGKSPDNLNKLSGKDRKYTKDYFDKVAEDQLTQKEVKKGNKKIEKADKNAKSN